MYNCDYCGKSFISISGLAGHLGHCLKNPAYSWTKEKLSNVSIKSAVTRKKNNPYKYLIKDFELVCEKCGKSYIVSTTQEKFDKGKHTKFCSVSCRNSHVVTDETKKKISESLKERELNKITEDDRKRRRKVYKCKVCGSEFTFFDNRDCGGRQYCSKKCKHEFLSKNTGGYRNGSGRGKSGWYKGIHCDSTWELAYVVYNIDHNINIKRCTEYRTYEYKGKIHKYVPDFVVDETLVEIKGFRTEQWEAKLKHNPDIKVIYKPDIKPYIEYVVSKYGYDYTNLYDSSNPKNDINGKQYIWMHNSEKTLCVKASEYNEYINKGYVRGRRKAQNT